MRFPALRNAIDGIKPNFVKKGLFVSCKAYKKVMPITRTI